MDMQHLAYFLAILVGIVSSGLIGSAWELATGEDARMRDLLDYDPTLLTPFRALVIMLSAPSKILADGVWWLIAQPFLGWLGVSCKVWLFSHRCSAFNKGFLWRFMLSTGYRLTCRHMGNSGSRHRLM
jgi:hypothetical protein